MPLPSRIAMGALRTSRTFGRFWFGPNFRYTIAKCPVGQAMQAARAGVRAINSTPVTAVTTTVGVLSGGYTIADAYSKKQKGELTELEWQLKFGGGMIGIFGGPASSFGPLAKFAGPYVAFVCACVGSGLEALNRDIVIAKELDTRDKAIDEFVASVVAGKKVDIKPEDLPNAKYERKRQTADEDLGLAIYSIVGPFASKLRETRKALVNVGNMLVLYEQARRNDLVVDHSQAFVSKLSKVWEKTADADLVCYKYSQL